MSIGGVPFNKLLVFLPDSMLIQYDIPIILAFSSDTSIHIKCEGTTVVQVLNSMIVSG